MDVINNFKHDFIAKMKDIKKEKGIYYSNYVNVSRGRQDGEDVLIFTENEAFLKTLEKYRWNTGSVRGIIENKI